MRMIIKSQTGSLRHTQQQDFTDCDAEVKLFLEKNLGFMLLRFEVTGTVKVFCDRCGNPLPLDLWDEFQVIVKLVEDPDNDEPGRRGSGCLLYIQNRKSSSPGRLDLRIHQPEHSDSTDV